MAKVESITARLPRGTKPVSQAFFNALATIPEASRAAGAKAAQGLIRDQIKMQRENAKTTASREKVGAAKHNARNRVKEKPIAAKAAPKGAEAASEA